MGTDHAGNKKWTGLKGPVGMLFSPRTTKRGVVIPGSRKAEDSMVENASGLTSSTEADESPQSGKPNKVGRLRRQEDDVTLTPGGTATGKAKRRQSGAMNLFRKAMFTQQNHKDDNSIITEASRDVRGISDSFGIDPLFDDELTSSKQSSVKPPSCSDLSTSEAYSSRTDISGFSAKVPTLKKGNEKQSDEMSQRPPRPGDRVLGPALSNDSKVSSNNDQNTQSGNKKGGQETKNTDTGKNAHPRSPRPMQTGVRNTLVGGTMDASFHPTLSQKLLIGKQEIEKKMEVRKKPLIDPLKLAPSTKSQDRKAVLAKGETKDKAASTTAKSGGTRRKSTGSDAVRREYAAKEASELNSESLQRPTTPTVLQPVKAPSRHRRPHHSHEKTEERRRHNSDGTSRSRGRSGPRHSYDQSPKTPAGSHHSTKDRKYAQHRARSDATELPRISNLDGSPSRTRHGSTKSPSRESHKDRKQSDVRRHGRSQDAHQHAGRPEEHRGVGEKKRPKSFDQSMSRDKSDQQDYPALNEHHDKDETERSRSSGHHRIRDHSSPHSRESHRTRTERSPTEVERKRSQSIDDSESRSKSPHHQARRSSYTSQNRSHSSGHRHQRGESSPHSRESHRNRSERSPTTPERKRSKSMDDSESRSKSPHQQSRRSSYNSQNRSRSRGHSGEPGESSPHGRETHRKRTEKMPTTPQRKRSLSMDDSQSLLKSPHQQSRRPSYGSRQRNGNKEDDTAHSRSRSREASAHSSAMQSPTFAVRKRSLSLDESRSSSRRSHARTDNLSGEQEDKVSTMNELWNELTRYGPPHLKKQENERSQMVVSKAEKQRRGELEETSRRNTPGHHSQSPGRRSTTHDDDGTVASGATTSRRQARRERREKGEDTSSSRASRPSTSPSHRSHRSSSSSHRQVPQTPSGRSERSTTRSTSREKWEKILHHKDTKPEMSNPVEPPFPTAASSNEAEGKTRPEPITDESKVKASTSVQPDMETLTQDDAKDGSQPPSVPNTNGPKSSSKPPAVADSQGEETFDKIPPSTILTESHYRAVNKMADRDFHSPLGDPPGMYSPTQRQANGRRVLLASSTAVQEGIAPLDEDTGNIASTTTKQEEDKTKTKNKDKDHDKNHSSSDVLVSPSSRAATLKNHLRQLEQLHGSVVSSNRSRSEPPSSTHTHRSSGASRYSRRPRPTEDRNGGVHDSATSGTSGISKPTSTTTSSSSSSTGISRSRQDRSDSLDHTNRRRHHYHQVIAHSDNSPGHGSQVPNNDTANNHSSIKSPTKDLGRFLKSPKPDKTTGDYETKSKQAAKTIMSLESVPASESTTES